MKATHRLTHREPAPGTAERMAPVEPHGSERDCCGAKSSNKLSALLQISYSATTSSLPFFPNVESLHFQHSQQLSQCCKKHVWLLLGMFWKYKPWKSHSVACKPWIDRAGLGTLESQCPSLRSQWLDGNKSCTATRWVWEWQCCPASPLLLLLAGM